MEELAIEARGLVKRYGRDLVAVDGLDLAVRVGEVYGLLGPNGAGKTTALRILLGLVRPTEGSVRVLGLSPGQPEMLRRVGAVGENAFYPFLSGRDNVRAAARRCRVGDDRVDTVLEMVALSPRAGDAFGTYSLGMKQRLGVAVALLKDPELLVLDEPSNGLDPVGQVEMSRVIRDLGQDGRTILLSSHDMDEVEQLCARVGVIVGGRMLAEGTPDDLRGRPSLWVRAQPSSALSGTPFASVAGARISPDGLRIALAEPDPRYAAEVNRSLVGAGLDVSEVRTERRPLREAFLDITGGRTAGADSVRGSGSSPGRHRFRRHGSRASASE